MAGEGFEIYAFDGAPFKHFKSIQPHTNFINKIAFNKEGSQFVSVSSDKTIIIHDTQTLDTVQKIEKAHSKGIIDVAWLDLESLVTVSTDATAKLWSVKEGKEIL
jgi:WD40 repeat protein